MRARLTALAAALTATITAAPALASPPCDVVPPLDALNGGYEVTVGNALVFGNNRIVPLRASETFAVTMEAQSDLLMMRAGPSVIVLEYADAEDGALDFKELEDVLNIGQDDFPALMGCGLDRLPVLTGGGLANSQEGTSIEFEYELVIWDYRAGQLPEMMGTLSWSGGGIQSIRAVTISPRS
jgi:hypothetical protein